MSMLHCALLGALLASPAIARAQDQAWPQHAVTLVVPFAPGGSVDNAARPLAEAIRRRLGPPLVVENRASGGGVIGTRSVAQARPDGHTLLIGSPGPLTIAPEASSDAPDPLRALAPIALVAESPQILVVTDGLPATTLQEFVALAKARPDPLNLGSAGIGTTPHRATEWLGRVAGLRFKHIPDCGTGAAAPDLAAGKIDALLGEISAVLPLAEAGRLLTLALTGQQRSPPAQVIPAAAELGFPTLLVRNWQAQLAPAVTPDPRLRQAAAGASEALDDKTVRAALVRQGSTPVRRGPEDLAAFLREERATWNSMLRAIGPVLQ